jgi:hypothetical protein
MQTELFSEVLPGVAATVKESLTPRLDPSEAPPGFFAVLKSSVSASLGNICRACDWRPDCSGAAQRCMSYTVVTSDGRELKRQDGCSVVFKRKATAEESSVVAKGEPS